jgi:hypothetical protein
MNIYKLSQNINNGWDTYDSCIVCAENEDEARLIHPSEYVKSYDNYHWYGEFDNGERYKRDNNDWVERTEVDKIKVELIGTAVNRDLKGVILASFNAG